MHLAVRQIAQPPLALGRAGLVRRAADLGRRLHAGEPAEEEREQRGQEREQQHAHVGRATGEREQDKEVRDELGREGDDLYAVKRREQPECAHAVEGAHKQIRLVQTVAHDGVRERRDVESETLCELLVFDKEAGRLVHDVLVRGA